MGRKKTDVIEEGEDTNDRSLEKRYLSDISKKLSLILTAVEKLTEVVSESNTANKSNVESQLQPTLSNMTEVLTQLTSNVGSSSKKNENLQAEALRIRNLMSNTWDFKMNKRKVAFWNMTKNKGHCETYKEWIARESPVVPLYLQKKIIRNEHPAQTKLRINGAHQEFKTQIELQELRFQQNQERFRKLDQEMEDFIRSRSTGETSQILIGMWKEESHYNEKISGKRWKRNKTWLNNYAENFPKQQGSNDPYLKVNIPPNREENSQPRRTLEPQTDWTEIGPKKAKTNFRYAFQRNSTNPERTTEPEDNQEPFLDESNSTATLTP